MSVTTFIHERTLTVVGAVATLALIATGHGPARWFWESVVEAAPFVEVTVVHLLDKI